MINTPMVERHNYGYNKIDPTLNDGHILQKLHDNGIIFCMSGVEDGTVLWMLTDTIDKNYPEASIMGYSKTVSLAIWDMAVEASIEFPDSEFATYFNTLQC